jgi:hypothetical protein
MNDYLIIIHCRGEVFDQGLISIFLKFSIRIWTELVRSIEGYTKIFLNVVLFAIARVLV